MRLLYRMEVRNIWRRFLSLSRLECVAWTLLWDKLTVLPSSFTVHDGWNAFAWVLGWTWSCRLQVRLTNFSMSSEGKACFCPEYHRLQFLHRVKTCTACHIPSQCSVYTMFGQYIFKSENWIFARLSLPILIQWCRVPSLRKHRAVGFSFSFLQLVFVVYVVYGWLITFIFEPN